MHRAPFTPFLLIMSWFAFVACAVAILLVGTRMTRDADRIADRTGLGRVFIGSILLAGATSAPELMTCLSAARLSAPDLVVGNVLGSNVCNMALLGVVDLWFRRVSVLANVALAQAFACALAVLLTLLTGVALLVRHPIELGGVGLEVWGLLILYLIGMWLLRATEQGETIVGTPLVVQPDPEISEKQRRQQHQENRRSCLSFALCTLAIVLIAPRLTASADDIARQTGLGATFVGTALLALVTSLPELTASATAVKMGSYDLAVGNLFGSNAFNIALLFVGDAFFRGPLLSVAQPAHALTAMLGSVLMVVALMSVAYRGPRKQTVVQWDASVLVALYMITMALLYRSRPGG